MNDVFFSKTFVTVLRLNFVRAVEITPFSMKLEVNVQLTDNITNGAIQYKLKSFGICGAWSVTERVEDALASAIGGVFTHEIHLLQPSTEYTPQIVFPAASDTSDGFPVMTGCASCSLVTFLFCRLFCYVICSTRCCSKC